MSVSEITVTVRDAEKSLKKSFLIYEEFTANITDPIIEKCIKEVLDNFQGEPDKIKVRISLEE